ncbi:hypothetical protein SprV_0401476300 [Sparganum proliferum]
MGPHFPTFLLQLAADEAHAGGAAMTAQTALAFRPESLFQMAVEMTVENVSEDLSSDGRFLIFKITTKDSERLFYEFLATPLLLLDRNLDASREQDKSRNIGLVCVRRVDPRVRLLQSDC